MLVNEKHYQSVWADFKSKQIYIINQQKLPFTFEILTLNTFNDVIDAISTLKVRGAPAIGITAAYALWLAIEEQKDNPENYYRRLIHCRPTAVNLKRGADVVYQEITKNNLNTFILFKFAENYAQNEINACKNIGIHGFKLIEQLYKEKQQSIHILTHCNAGWLACGDYGTALAPIYEAKRNNIPIHVWVDETRPLNQGSRITAWELYNEKIPFSIITDNTGALLMMRNQVDIVIVGADRIALNGDVANKIGTYQKALAAKYHNIPFVVAAPITTFDKNIETGTKIPIEQRNADELYKITAKVQNSILEVDLYPEYFDSVNYAFDITPAAFVNYYITEYGLFDNIEIIWTIYEQRMF